jgi:hypothetical protein
MPSVPQFDVDLNAPPERRWDGLANWRDVAHELLAFYLRDIGGLDAFAPLLRDYRDAFVDAEYVAEMRGIARAIDGREEEVALANLYYDAIKLVMSGGLACTAFAVDTDAGPLHARNLDWTTADGLLASETMVFNFRRGGGEPLYRTVGWPGFIGCLSGVATGRFAVTLNAVISDDPPELAPPITFVLRRALETCKTFDEATTVLCDTRVVSDSLLLVSGTRAGEMAVIERAPTRAAVRHPDAGAVFVTNDYRALAATERETRNQSALTRTACGRYDRAQKLVREAPPRNPEACFRVLADAQVKMGITVQHMVLSAATGEVHVALPSKA